MIDRLNDTSDDGYSVCYQEWLSQFNVQTDKMDKDD